MAPGAKASAVALAAAGAAAWCGGASALSANEIPRAFDFRDKFFGCGLQVVDQGQCGSCWATSGTAVLGDRFCAFYGEDGKPLSDPEGFGGNRLFQAAGSCTGDGTSHMEHNHGCKRTAMYLSPQALMSCGTFVENRKLYPNSAGCNGGEAEDAWRYFFEEGLTSMTADGRAGCTPYTSGMCTGKDPNQNGCRSCSGVVDQCENGGQKPTRYRVDSFGWIMEKGLSARTDTSGPRPESERAAMAEQVRKMQVELMANGPLHVCVDFFSNWQNFFNANPLAVYNSTQGAPKSGGHCLSIIGWGEDATGQPYWLIKNSWGAGWGSHGVFRFLRGVDLCGVESDVWAGCPEGSKCRLTEGVVRQEPRVRVSETVTEARRLGGVRVELDFEVLPAAGEARRPSRGWKGGYWHELPRADWSHPTIARHIEHAYEDAYGEPVSLSTALAAARRVWTQAGVNGIKVRVEFDDSRSVEHHHRPDGTSVRI